MFITYGYSNLKRSVVCLSNLMWQSQVNLCEGHVWKSYIWGCLQSRGGECRTVAVIHHEEWKMRGL